MELNEEEEEEEGEKEVRGQAEARDEEDERGSIQEEVQFQLVLTYNDFAVQCFSRGLYAEATLLLNKAIEEEKGQAGLYLNRGGEAMDTRSVSVYVCVRLFLYCAHKHIIIIILCVLKLQSVEKVLFRPECEV